jgi:hypothetical protein
MNITPMPPDSTSRMSFPISSQLLTLRFQEISQSIEIAFNEVVVINLNHLPLSCVDMSKKKKKTPNITATLTSKRNLVHHLLSYHLLFTLHYHNRFNYPHSFSFATPPSFPFKSISFLLAISSLFYGCCVLIKKKELS